MLQPPGLNYRWYSFGARVTIEIYERGLQEGDVSVSLSQENPALLEVSLRGAAHVFELCAPVREPRLRLSDVKAEISLESATGKKNWSCLLACEEKRPDPLAERYRRLDAAGEDDASTDFMDAIRKVYREGSDDVKRAMTKSYYESGGTVLSTNWDEVGSKRVEPHRGTGGAGGAGV